MEKILKLLDDLEAQYGKWLMLFVLIPFLYPRGFAETSAVYKGFFTLWLYGAMAVIAVWVLYDLLKNGLKQRWTALAVLLYYGLFFGISVYTQGRFREGLQKIFSAPALFLFCFTCLRKDARRLLWAAGWILTVIFTLNMSVFAPPIAEKMIGIFHVNFLGHVQAGAQYGLLGLLVGYLLLELYPERKELAWVLLGTSLVTIAWSQTLVGYLVLAILALGLVLQRAKPLQNATWLQRVLAMDSRILLVSHILIGFGLLAYSLLGVEVLTGGDLLSLNGRTFVWRDGMARFLQRPVLGYGVYGVKLETFWSEGMNYAHSEILQRLLDGGALLCVAFLAMLWVLLSTVHRTGKQNAVIVTNILLAAVLLVMLFESVTEYHYINMFLAIVACLPEICGQGAAEKEKGVE